MFKSWTVLLVATGVLLTAGAATQRFRGGELLRAEVTTDAPEIVGLDLTTYADLPGTPAYAALSLRLDPNRELSVYDYSLTAYGNSFRCVAISRNSGKFVVDDWKFSSEPGTVYTLLFVVDGKLLGDNAVATYELKCNAPPAGAPTTRVGFRKLGSSPLRSAPSSHSSGEMTSAAL